MLGQKFAKLTVVASAPTRYYGARRKPNRFWICECKCGNLITRVEKDLKSGYTKACPSCRQKGTKNSKYKHGACGGIRGQRKESAEYRCWKTIKSRCYNPRFAAYKYYGARGIRVCERWLNSFEHFLADMGPKPTPKHQIDREDNDGDYCPANCHWTTDRQQRRNKSTTKLIILGNKTQCLTDWLKELGRAEATYRYRVKHGWTIEEALLGRARR